MITLRHIYTLLFFAGLFFIPFNNFEGLSFLGEYQREAGSYFFILAFGVLCLESLMKGSVNLPYKNVLFQMVCLFVLWTILATLFNLPSVLDSFYKQTSGIGRFIRQFISLILSAFVFFTLFWNIIRVWNLNQILKYIRTPFLIGLIFVFVYGVIETAIVVFGIGALKPILNLYNFFPFVNVELYDGLGRIKGVSYRVPDLGNYLVYISAWMFSYILTHKSIYRFIPTLMILFLMVFSGSRTALVNVTFQLFLFGGLLFLSSRYRQFILKLIAGISVAIGILFVFNSKAIIHGVAEKIESLNFTKNTDHDISNRTRFGMQYASIQVFKKHPVTGVGLGQETYYKIYEYPNWATRNNWEYDLIYKNQKIKSFPPAYNLYTRLLAETGIIGFCIFILMTVLPITNSYRLWKIQPNPQLKIVALIILISLTGLFINWLQVDFFKQYGFWLCLAILIKLMIDVKNQQAPLQQQA
jgi:O-antigen ligase